MHGTGRVRFEVDVNDLLFLFFLLSTVIMTLVAESQQGMREIIALFELGGLIIGAEAMGTRACVL